MNIELYISESIDFLTSGFDGKEDSIYSEMMEESDEYPVQDNLALNPSYQQNEQKSQNLKVVSHPNYRGYEVMVCEPRSYEDSISIVKHLKDRKTVVLNCFFHCDYSTFVDTFH